MGAGALKVTVGTLQSPARSGQWFRELRNVPLWGYEDGQWTCRGASWVLGEQVWDELGARGTWAGQWGAPEGGAALLVLMSPPLTPVASQTSPGSPSLPGPARRPLQQARPFPLQRRWAGRLGHPGPPAPRAALPLEGVRAGAVVPGSAPAQGTHPAQERTPKRSPAVPLCARVCPPLSPGWPGC